MISNIIDTSLSNVSIEKEPVLIPLTGYEKILHFYNLNYSESECYFQIGEITRVQGWILHISAVISQIEDTLKTIIPVLLKENVPFKIAQDKETAVNLLTGNLGVAQIGKIISIYPHSDEHALEIAKKLIALTESFKGPAIPTDILLGNTIYVRYGAHKAVLLINSNGNEEKHIYNSSGQLIKDPYSIPFKLPHGVTWPFEELASEKSQPSKKILNRIYKPVSFLKNDPRGNVFKGLYLKNLFHVKKCVIKQGFKNMCSEDSERTIHDRLQWQEELYHELPKTIPLPEIFDIFQEDGNTYLVMEYINGDSLYDKINKINPDSRAWLQLPTPKRLQLLNYVIRITSIIDNLHKNGFVHRDIVPANFLVDKKGNIVLIDMELGYSLKKDTPNPPFRLGTMGFMSPEQINGEKPTVKEDIFAIGALILQVLTGLAPVKFRIVGSNTLFENLQYFVGDDEITNMIMACLHSDPKSRPELEDIHTKLINYKHSQQETNTNYLHSLPYKFYLRTYKDIISAAIAGLNKPPVVVSNDLWYSKSVSISNSSALQHKEYIKYTGICEGVAGVLYLLARVHKVGYNISTSVMGYKKGWAFLEEQYANTIKDAATGLYSGSIGIALAWKEGIDSGLIDDSPNNREKLIHYLQIPLTAPDIAEGIAGQGIVTLQSLSYLPHAVAQHLLDMCVNTLLSYQQKNGSWIPTSSKKDKKTEKSASFGYGNPGIIWFLLEYSLHYPNKEVEKAIRKGLRWLLKRTRYTKNPIDPAFFEKISISRNKSGDHRKGFILTFIKAFEVLQDERCRKLAEEALLQYPSCLISNNFSQQNGLAGMGEIYIEAARVFSDNKEWECRANWLASVFVNTFKRNPDGSGHWKMEEMNYPTADFFTGNSGIIHFLARYVEPKQIGYRFLQ